MGFNKINAFSYDIFNNILWLFILFIAILYYMSFFNIDFSKAIIIVCSEQNFKRLYIGWVAWLNSNSRNFFKVLIGPWLWRRFNKSHSKIRDLRSISFNSFHLRVLMKFTLKSWKSKSNWIKRHYSLDQDLGRNLWYEN